MHKDPPHTGSFKWLNTAQFFGALNDNIFKFLIIFALIAAKGQEASSTVNAIIGALFALPFLLFIAAAGVLADRVSKSRIVVGTKMAEVGIMAIGATMLWLESSIGLYVVVFLMSTQSAIFSPSKFGIIPELVRHERISKANSYIQAFTYLAIIIGTVGASVLSIMNNGEFGRAALFCIGFAILGLLASLRIQPTKPAGGTARFSPLFIRDIWRTLRIVRKDSFLFLAVLSAGYFLLIGAYIQLNVIPYGIEILQLDESKTSLTILLFLPAALGIGLGSLAAGKLSGRNVEFGIVPLGSLVMTLATVGLFLVQPGQVVPAALFILLLGFGGGLFIVPVQSFIQVRTPREQLGEVLAATSFLSWMGVLVASALLYVNAEILHLTAGQGFLVLGIFTLLLTLFSMIVLPDFLLRFIVLCITRTVYRLRIIGDENIPTTGSGMFVCNHVSLVDAVMLIASEQRRIRFLMSREFYDQAGWLKPLLRLGGVILIHEGDNPKKIVKSLRSARQALDDGYLVGIFAEGHVTRSGLLMEFKPGFERILKGSDHPIIPVYIGGAWGSAFSYAKGTPKNKLLLDFRHPVTVIYGPSMPTTSSAFDVQQRVVELSCEYFESLKPARKSMGEEFVRRARKSWSSHALSDSSGKELSYGETLIAAHLLSRTLKTALPNDPHIGVLLPAGVGGALANLALAFQRRVPVNLNYTASLGALRSALVQSEITSVITARAFVEKFPDVPLPDQVLYIEDLLTGFTGGQKAAAWLRSRYGRLSSVVKRSAFDPDETAVIIFSSGTTAEPKGVMLTHHNILSNIEGFCRVLRPQPTDNICSALPFFHSFGFTCTLWFPLLSGCSVVYHANPLEAAKIGELAESRKSTMLFSTPSFLLGYIRRVKPGQFKALRLVYVGAEKLNTRVANAFEEKFGLAPLEGYGCTELSPVCAGSVPDVTIDGLRQTGAKQGSVGQALPGVVTRIVDPESFEPLPPGQPGLLLVKGPNVMKGYLGMPEKTAEAIQDGWYNTGDIAVLEADGFLSLTDRLSRFSKIAGEMVPHAAIEEALHAVFGGTARVFAVTSVPDERRGERLVVLYTEEAGDILEIQKQLQRSELANLWKPATKDYRLIDEIPLLGTGKLDLQAIKALASDL